MLLPFGLRPLSAGNACRVPGGPPLSPDHRFAHQNRPGGRGRDPQSADSAATLDQPHDRAALAPPLRKGGLARDRGRPPPLRSTIAGDITRGGRHRRADPEHQAAPRGTHSTLRTMAQQIGVGPATVHQTCQAYRLQPSSAWCKYRFSGRSRNIGSRRVTRAPPQKLAAFGHS